MKLCSACLLGVRCRYDGKSKANKKVLELAKKETLIPFCPEQLGGLPTPRPSTEIYNGSGEDVLNNKTKVIDQNNKDISREFVLGAQETLNIAKLFSVKEAILKQRSPSCGCGQIYDGTFSKNIIKGDGVTTALLKQNDIEVVSEEDLL